MSYASRESVLRSTTQPLTNSGANALASLTQVLGVTNMNYVHNPDEENPAEVMGLQRALEGKNAYVGFSLISMMTSANPALLQLFPVKRTNTLTHEYNYIDFPKEFAVETSPGSAPGYPTFAKSKRTATLTMYQFGATTTFQELRHSEGLMIWYGKLITLAISFTEVAESLVVQCLLDTPSYYAEYFIKSGKHEIDLSRAGRLHDLFFDILHRRENGMAELIDAVRSDMQNSRSIVPTDMLISEGIATLSVTKLHTEYYRHGPGAAENAVKLTDAFPAVYDGIRITKVRSLDFREKRLHINLLERHVQIGQNFALDHFHPSADMSQWTTNWLTIAVFSMETDDWAYIGIKEAIDHSGRFDRADGRLSKHHYRLAADPRGVCKRANVPITKDNRIDMFIYETRTPNTQESTFHVATVFGHMEKWALSEEAVERTGATIVNYLRRTVGDDALNTIGIGLDNINELYERSLTAADVQALENALGANVGRYGVPAIPANPPAVPAGYGTVAGYHEIAQTAPGGALSASLVAQAQAFVKAAKKFYRALLALFPCDHIALDGKSAPSAYFPEGTSQNSEFAAVLALFQNIVDSNKLTLGRVEAVARTTPTIAEISTVITNSTAANAFGRALGEVPLDVYNKFNTQAKLAAFATAFAESRFARLYGEGLQVARRGRGARVAGAASTDMDGAAGAAPVSFEKFLELELPKGTDYQNGRLLSQVVALVTSSPGELPTAIDAATLEAWRGAAAAPANTTAGRFKASGLAVSLDALLGAPPNQLAFVSPYGDGSGQTAAQAKLLTTADAKKMGDGSGANANILRAAFHVQSKARGRPGALESDKPRGFSTSALPPSFAQAQFTDIAGNEVVINQNLHQRFEAAARHADWVVRVAQQMLVLAPICLQTMHSMCKNHVMPPVAVLLEQPWRRYRTSTGILVSKPSQGDLGNVLVLDPDCTVGYNAIGKNMMANVTMYMGAIAMDCQNWYVAHDIAVVGYDGGETAKLFDLSQQNLLSTLGSLKADSPSILPFMEPAGSIADKNSVCKVPSSHNIRGYRSAAYYQANSVERNMEFAYKPMHPSAAFYTSYLELHKLAATTDDWKFHQNRATFNTETHRGLSLVYDVNTRQLDRVVMPQDHFKTAVYPGCKENRMSTLANHYKDMNYESRAIGGF